MLNSTTFVYTKTLLMNITSIKLNDTELEELKRQSKQVLGKVNVNGYIRYLINKNREL